jgi:DNA-binding XRE family transcriptional regulator
MNELIDRLKKVKNKTDMSQEKLAQEIGVTLQTVHRWLNGKFEPSIHVEKSLKDFLKKHE